MGKGGFLPDINKRSKAYDAKPRKFSERQSEHAEVKRKTSKSQIFGPGHGGHNGGGHEEEAENLLQLGQLHLRSIRDIPIDIEPKQLLRDVGKRIRLPRREGFFSFKGTLKSATSCNLCAYYFWHLYCKRYLESENKAKLTARFMDLLSEKFVALFSSLPNSSAKDYFFEYYPYAVAEVVNLAFQRHFPGSKVEYTELFKNKLFVETRKAFSGVDTSVELMHEKRSVMGLVGEEEEKSLLQNQPEPEERHHVRSENIDEWTKEELQAELKKIPGYIERKKERVKRSAFDATDNSPMVSHFVANISNSAKSTSKTCKMKWTLPPVDLHKPFKPVRKRTNSELWALGE